MSTRERLEELFRAAFGDDSIVLTPGTTADDVEGWDSVAHINLMFLIEEEFGVQFDEDELAAMADVGELERWLDEHATR